MTRKAKGRHYFAASGYPIAAVRIRIARDGRATHPHDLTETEHDHDFRELVIVVRGEAQQRLQGRSYPVSTGDVYILHDRSRHCFHDIRELEILNVMYDPSRIPLPAGALRQLPGYSALFLLEPHYRKRHQFSSRLRLGPAALEQARSLAGDMIREVEAGKPGRGVLLLARLLEMMTFLSRQYEQTRNSSGRELLRIGGVIGTMEREFARAWSIDELSALAHMSRSTFLRTFRRALGRSPLGFLQDRRFDAARRQLRDSDRAVTQIALECGFSDSNYFARQFRRRYGLTPTSYRARG